MNIGVETEWDTFFYLDLDIDIGSDIKTDLHIHIDQNVDMETAIN